MVEVLELFPELVLAINILEVAVGRVSEKARINTNEGLTHASDNGFLIADGEMAERLKATVC